MSNYLDEFIPAMNNSINNVYNTAYTLGIEHAIDLVLAVAAKHEKFPADIALLLVNELEKRKPK